MARAPRPVGHHVTYHVMSRGNRGTQIFLDDHDRQLFLELLGKTHERFDWTCFAYCLMGNHFHLTVTTRQPNLPSGMHFLLGNYARTFNRIHGLRDHLFGRRYHAVVVGSDRQLVAAVRYIARNPTRSCLVENPAHWPWASYPSAAGLAEPPPFFDPAIVLNLLGGHDEDQSRLALRQLVEQNGTPTRHQPECHKPG